MDIEDLIRFENESTYLDFKAIQYKNANHPNLLKDILAMANASYSGPRFIIIGVKPKGDGTRELIGVTEDAIDEASYQQLVNANITPSLSITYLPKILDGKTFWVFTIDNCNDQPYLMKKDNGNLKEAAMWIRKGSTQMPLSRSDLDAIFTKKFEKPFESDNLIVHFSNEEEVWEVTIPKDIKLPSDSYREILKRELLRRKAPFDPNDQLLNNIYPPTQNYYERLSEEKLEEDILKVRDRFKPEDFYYKFEEKGELLNLIIINKGTEYVEDATLEIEIDKDSDFMISGKVHREVNRDWHSGHLHQNHRSSPDYDVIDYPEVTSSDLKYFIKQELGNIKHQIPATVFKIPIRIYFESEAAGKEILVKVKVFGKTLKYPIYKELKIVVKQ